MSFFYSENMLFKSCQGPTPTCNFQTGALLERRIYLTRQSTVCHWLYLIIDGCVSSSRNIITGMVKKMYSSHFSIFVLSRLDKKLVFKTFLGLKLQNPTGTNYWIKSGILIKQELIISISGRMRIPGILCGGMPAIIAMLPFVSINIITLTTALPWLVVAHTSPLPTTYSLVHSI